MMQLLFTILCFGAVVHTTDLPKDYQKVFGEDYQKALVFCQTHQSLMNQVAQKYNMDTHELVSIIFPELIRHSVLSDFFETKALELLYVEEGTRYADFSIGYFQMKPSFAEKVEEKIKRNPIAYKAFLHLIEFSTATENGIRQERLERLRSVKLQMEYLCCFYHIVELKMDAHIWDSKASKIQFFATAYNSGFEQNQAAIFEKMELQYFPYGASYDQEHQHAYADIAVDYYKHFSI